MVIDLILIIAGILGLTIASITDIKKREVPDTISIGLIILALILRLANSIITNQWSYLTTGLLWLAIFYALGAFMFYTKQWGGGDSKMLIALGVLYATPPTAAVTNSIPFPITILFNILIIGSIYGLIWSFFLILKHRKKFNPQFLKKLKQANHLKKVSLLIILITIALSILIKPLDLKIITIIIGIIFAIYPFLYLAIKTIEKIAFYKTISVKKLTEGDWITKNIYKNNKLIYSNKNYGITKKDIKKLIKSNIKTVTIKEGIPFLPAFLIGTLISLFLGNILLLII